MAGSSDELRYAGETLARKGIIAITVNYRLGIFGFFSLPELTKESPNHASGNYGYLDQAAALKNSEIAEELALPPVKIHCSILAEDAIKAAVADYRQKHLS